MTATEIDGLKWAKPGAYVPGLARVEYDGVRMWWVEATQVYPWTLDVVVVGKAESKGNLTTFVTPQGARNTTMKNGPALKTWETHIAAEVRQGWGNRIATSDAVGVALDFVFPRRASAPKTFTPHKTAKPDLDKITRGVWDALTHIVLSDDAQVITSAETKREAEIDETPGVRIRVAVIPPVPRPIGRGPR